MSSLKYFIQQPKRNEKKEIDIKIFEKLNFKDKMKPQKMECVICSEIFDTDIHNSRYCSEECRIDAKGYVRDNIFIAKKYKIAKKFCWE